MITMTAYCKTCNRTVYCALIPCGERSRWECPEGHVPTDTPVRLRTLADRYGVKMLPHKKSHH